MSYLSSAGIARGGPGYGKTCRKDVLRGVDVPVVPGAAGRAAVQEVPSRVADLAVPHDPDAAERAIKCGNDMLSAFETLSSEWHTKFGLETGLGIGVNKGEVVAGNVGSPAYTSFTIIGDAVNIASRLMQRARAGELLLSERVMLALLAGRVKVDAIPLPALTLRGRSEPIGLYCIPFKGRIDTR